MIEKHTENCVAQSWVSSNCDICKSAYPFTIFNSKKEIELFKMPDPPFIVFKSIGSDEGLAESMHIFSFEDGNKIVVGSGDDADFYIYDGSVSSHHAVIRYIDGCFIIEDNNSKFGTTLYAGKKIIINSLNWVTAQISNTVLSFSTNNKLFGIKNTGLF
ncbi:hypothetical protein SteCoe_22313 [Stentor coeruleus]|uniref:FHA domain-containing protein n=1 Tax=Stentor coeruleus TaxID=5963 RepID=A0A1R2BMS2_9CILI|nr:hypothetical protein SteCoe_22313 [Stentor coeruleus]